MGAPDNGRKLGLAGYADPRSDGNIYTWLPLQDESGAYLTLADKGALTPGQERRDWNPIWTSPRLQGRILDVTFGIDPRGSKKPGFFVLETGGPDGKGRVVEFLALD